MAKKVVDEETLDRAGEYSPEVQRLIAKGKEQGYVTQQEIAGVLPEAEENLEELDELYAALLEQGVEITDQKDALIWDKDEEDTPDPVEVSRGDMFAAAKRSDLALSFEGTVLNTATVGRRGARRRRRWKI